MPPRVEDPPRRLGAARGRPAQGAEHPCRCRLYPRMDRRARDATRCGSQTEPLKSMERV
jgi:hypothetical protein